MGTSAGAAKRARCGSCGQWHGPQKACGKPGPEPTVTPEQRRETDNAATRRRYRKRTPVQQERANAYARQITRRTRVLVLTAYSTTGEPSCACCGETHYEFLTLDHIDGNGAARRRATGTRGGVAYYRTLMRADYPPGYRVLCMNCNFAIGMYGACPHDLAR